jgi:hypothetical protein
MKRWIDHVEWRTVRGAPVTAHGMTVTPEARVLIVAGPHGGLVWNRPVAMRVARDGMTRRLPIFNVTWAAQVGLLSAGLAASALLRRRAAHKGEESRP